MNISRKKLNSLQINNNNKNLFEIDYLNIYQNAEIKSKEYQLNNPFPNCVIDNFFNPVTYQNILDTFPDEDSEIWKTPSNPHTLYNIKYIKK